MEKMNILRELFDEKIVRTINLFLKYPEKQFYLTEVSKLSKVNVSTSLRILAKLVSQGFIKTVSIGKVRLYQLEKSEKTHELMRVLKSEDKSPLEEFIEKITESPRVKKIILESRKLNSAKVIIVGDYFSKERINKVCEDIKRKYNFGISFVEISEGQYAGLKNFEAYSLDKKILWERKK